MKKSKARHAKKSKKTRNKRKIIRLLFVFVFAVSSLYIINYFYNMNKAENEKDNLLNDVEIETRRGYRNKN